MKSFFINIISKINSIFFSRKIISENIFEINKLDQDKRIYKIKFFLKFLILVFFSLIFVFPNGINIKSKKIISHKEIIFVLDSSLSMLSKDDLEIPRLERAKNIMYQIIEQNLGSKFALVSIAGESFISMPLTGDSNSLKLILKRFEPKITEGSNPEISSLGKNIGIITKFSEEKNQKKYIILLSDGEFHYEDYSLGFFKKTGIKILSIGIGKKEGGKIPISGTGGTIKYKKINGEDIITKLDENSLKKISSITNGNYFYENDVNGILAYIQNNFETISSKSSEEENFPLFQVILFLILFLVIFDIFAFRIFKKNPV